MKQKFIRIITAQISSKDLKVKDFMKNKISQILNEVEKGNGDMNATNLFLNKDILKILEIEDSVKVSVVVSGLHIGKISNIYYLFDYLNYVSISHEEEIVDILNNIYRSFEDSGFYRDEDLSELLDSLCQKEENKDKVKQFINKLFNLSNGNRYWYANW